jgi:alkylhydroperoxidase/carboxymuconolactone decarboxylase family protein YurZ
MRIDETRPFLKELCLLRIAIAINAEHGVVRGPTSLGQRDIELGVTKEEIIEALRVAYFVGGNRALFTSAVVLKNLFK